MPAHGVHLPTYPFTYPLPTCPLSVYIIFPSTPLYYWRHIQMTPPLVAAARMQFVCLACPARLLQKDFPRQEIETSECSKIFLKTILLKCWLRMMNPVNTRLGASVRFSFPMPTRRLQIWCHLYMAPKKICGRFINSQDIQTRAPELTTLSMSK